MLPTLYLLGERSNKRSDYLSCSVNEYNIISIQLHYGKETKYFHTIASDCRIIRVSVGDWATYIKLVMIFMHDHGFVTDEQDNLSPRLECRSDFVPLMVLFRYLGRMLKCTDERQNGFIYKKTPSTVS